jgi:3-phytase
VKSLAHLARCVIGAALTPALLSAVPIVYETSIPDGGHGELDTPAVWVGPGASRSYLFVTDKTWDYVEVHDPIRNLYLGRVGGPGSTPGFLARPNAVAIAYGVATAAGSQDVLFIVERDNQRISALMMPYGHYLGAFGDASLDTPMGIALHRENGQLQAWITDIGPSPHRVVVFDVVPGPGGLTGTLRQSLPMPGGSVLESIAIDPATRRVLVCDESAGDVMVFDLQGTLLGRFGAGLFSGDPEGMVIFDTGDGNGYLIATDQDATPVVQWEVFDRLDYHFVTRFSGPTVGTDGITLVQQPLPGFPYGAFFAVHADNTVHAYSWADIAAATGLCPVSPCGPVDAGEPAAGTARQLARFPTPLRDSGTLHFRLNAPASVELCVYDLRGGRVAQLARSMHPAGAHEIDWDGRGSDGRRLPSGVYLVRGRLGDTAFSQKITLVR